MSFVKIDTLIGGVARRSGDPDAFEAAYILETVNSHIAKIYGERSEDCVRAIRFRDGILAVGVINSVWAHELKMKEYCMKDFFTSRFAPVELRRITYVTGFSVSN